MKEKNAERRFAQIWQEIQGIEETRGKSGKEGRK